MKNILLMLLSFICLKAFSQAPPQLMNYQTVVRNSTGAILTNATVALTFIIHDGSSTGVSAFTETQYTTSNSEGLVVLQIGSVADSLAVVNWGSGPKYLEVDANINSGGTVHMGTTQLISVPYALYAQSSGSNSSSSVPSGTIVAFGGTTPPSGWLLCDGSTYPQSGQYANLYAAIQNNFGGGNGYFFVPDFRGRFLRGVDSSGSNNAGVVATNDPDAASRTSMNTGGNTGARVGSVEVDTFASHTHSFPYPYSSQPYVYPNASEGGFPNTDFGSIPAGVTYTWSTTATGGSETRPKNAYVNYIIKY